MLSTDSLVRELFLVCQLVANCQLATNWPKTNWPPIGRLAIGANWRPIGRLDWIGNWPDEPDFFGLDWQLVGRPKIICPIGPPWFDEDA